MGIGSTASTVPFPPHTILIDLEDPPETHERR
jgi:hypothetical protein